MKKQGTAAAIPLQRWDLLSGSILVLARRRTDAGFFPVIEHRESAEPESSNSTSSITTQVAAGALSITSRRTFVIPSMILAFCSGVALPFVNLTLS